MNLKRILFLGHTFPPGIVELAPPPNRLIESSLVESIRPWFEIRRVAITDGSHQGPVPWDLTLVEKKPELLRRLQAIRHLKRSYIQWGSEGFVPDLIFVSNFCPIYNAFLRWLRRQRNSPPVCLFLQDSTTLRSAIPPFKRFRRRFKPLAWPDDEMVGFVHACVSTSRSVGEWFPNRGFPWHWLPNGVNPKLVVRDAPDRKMGPGIRFGFFGAISDHTGIPALLRIYTAKPRNAELAVCGFGKSRQALEKEYQGREGVTFLWPLLPDDCLRFGASCDVLVNPRPIARGNECNFSSKVLEYSMTGRAILSSKVSGVDEVLGPEAWYFSEHDFDRTLATALDELAATPRSELDRRGQATQKRVMERYSWPNLGENLAPFLDEVISRGKQPRPSPQKELATRRAQNASSSA